MTIAEAKGWCGAGFAVWPLLCGGMPMPSGGRKVPWRAADSADTPSLVPVSPADKEKALLVYRKLHVGDKGNMIPAGLRRSKSFEKDNAYRKRCRRDVNLLPDGEVLRLASAHVKAKLATAADGKWAASIAASLGAPRPEEEGGGMVGGDSKEEGCVKRKRRVGKFCNHSMYRRRRLMKRALAACFHGINNERRAVCLWGAFDDGVGKALGRRAAQEEERRTLS